GVQRSPSYPGKRKKIVNKNPHLTGGILDDVQVSSGFLVECFSQVFFQKIEESADVAEGGAEVVGNRIRERFQLLVRRFKLRGPLFDSLLELCIEFSNFLFHLLQLSDVNGDAQQRGFRGPGESEGNLGRLKNASLPACIGQALFHPGNRLSAFDDLSVVTHELLRLGPCRYQIQVTEADHLVGFHAVGFSARPVREEMTATAVLGKNERRHKVNSSLQESLVILQRPLGSFAFGDVFRENENAFRDGLNADLEPPYCPIGKSKLILHPVRGPVYQAMLYHPKHIRGFNAWPHIHIFPA